MAEITIGSGSLYFLREFDYLTEELGPYVKIGVVHTGRSTDQRIKDHQTGNPRDIRDLFTIDDVPLVVRLETQLHYLFNERRIVGEWFLLNDEELKPVIKEAKKLCKEQKKYLPDVELAQSIKSLKSNGKTRAADKEDEKLKKQYVDVKLRFQIADAHLDLTRHALEQAIGKYGIVEGIYELTKTKDTVSFDAAQLNKDKPALYAKYCSKKPGKISGTFKVLGQIALKKAEEDLYDQLKAISKPVYTLGQLSKKKERTAKLESLHTVYLEKQKDMKGLELELALVEARLKAKANKHDAIKDVCTWERTKGKDTSSFNEKDFEGDHPKLHKKYLKDKKGVYKPIFSPMRPYPV